MIQSIRYCLILAFFFPIAMFAQQEVKTNSTKDIDVTMVYEQVVKEGYGTPKVYKKLANAYYFDSNYVQAKKWFETLFEAEETTDETILYRYSQTLKALDISLESNPYLIASENKIDH